MRIDPGWGTASSTTSRWRALAVAAAVLLGLVGCSGPARKAARSHEPAAARSHEPAAGQPAAAAPIVGGTSSVAAITVDPAQAAYDRMSQAQRIGQLFMVGTPVTGLGAATRTAITTYHVGNVVLTGGRRPVHRPCGH